MKCKSFIFLIFFISWNIAGAQSFKWQADLESVNTSSFYKIALSPQIISKTENSDLADIRIFEKNKETAYLIRQIPDSIYAKDTTALKQQNYTIVPSPAVIIKQDKTNQRTIIHITFNATYQIDKLVLSLKGFQYYRRTAWLTETNPLIRNRKHRYSENKIENFIISSKKQPVIDLSGKNRYKQLFLIIDNEDSAPLSIKNIKAYQKNIELITYLEKGKQYIMKTGQLNVPLPRYDLSYFNDSISNTVPLIHAVNFKMAKDEALIKDSSLIKKSWMWVAIGLLILFLGYLSFFMVSDMQRKKQKH